MYGSDDRALARTQSPWVRIPLNPEIFFFKGGGGGGGRVNFVIA